MPLKNDSTRTICNSIRELYRHVLRTHKLIAEYKRNGMKFNIPDEEDLIRHIYVSAKKMNAKLMEYSQGIAYTEDQKKKAYAELDLIKKEFA